MVSMLGKVEYHTRRINADPVVAYLYLDQESLK